MKQLFRGYAATAKGQPLRPFEYDPGELGPEEVEVAVEYCGICHSDLSMLDNEWGMTKYPIVPGHEIVGRVTAIGSQAKNLRVGQRVGIGWTAATCMACTQCLSGHQNLCPTGQGVIVNHHGGFADRVRRSGPGHPLADSLDLATAGRSSAAESRSSARCSRRT